MLLGQTVLFTVSSLQFVTGLLRLRIRASFRTEEPWKCSHSSYYILSFFFFCFWRDTPLWARASSLTRFLDHTTMTHHSRQDSSGREISPSQRPLPDNTQHSQQTDIHAHGGIRTHNLSRQAAADLCLRPCDGWDRHIYIRGKCHTQSIGWYTETEIRGKVAIQQQSMGPLKYFDFKYMSMIKI